MSNCVAPLPGELQNRGLVYFAAKAPVTTVFPFGLTLSPENLLLMTLNEQGFRTIGTFAPGFTIEFQLAGGAVDVLEQTLPLSSISFVSLPG